ncbi:hypothetical protein HaLaN_03175, partial [Haematococcus lacustris]
AAGAGRTGAAAPLPAAQEGGGGRALPPGGQGLLRRHAVVPRAHQAAHRGVLHQRHAGPAAAGAAPHWPPLLPTGHHGPHLQ